MVAPKREKMACQRSMTQKNREKERKRGVAMSQKKEKKERDDTRERTNALRSKPYPSIHPLIQLHLLIEIVRLVSPLILSLILQYMECKYALSLHYPEIHKSFM